MEYLPYTTLRKHKSLSESEIVLIVRQLIETVQYLHSYKISHRDIKPDKLMYDKEEGRIHLIDFGICKKFYERGKRKDMWTPTGTLAYKAPDMLEGGGYN
jgi:serine/threonine protein kinase